MAVLILSSFAMGDRLGASVDLPDFWTERMGAIPICLSTEAPEAAKLSMDPLSIIGFTISVVGATITLSGALVDLISDIKNIPNALLVTSNDVTDLRLILTKIEESIAQEELLLQTLQPALNVGQLAITGNVPAAAPEAPSLVQRARDTLTEIEDVVRKYTALQNVRGIGVLGRVRFLNRSKLRTLRDDLRGIKLDIATHFSVKGTTCAIQSALLITRLSGTMLEATRENEHQRRMLFEILRQFTEGEQRRTNDLIRALALRFLSEPGVQQIEAAPPDPNSAASTERTPPLTEPSDYNSSVFKLDISRFRKNACRPFCSCTCHRRYRRRAPTLTNKLLGSLFFGYSSLPFFKVSCDELTCIQPSTFSATFTYYFPSWFIVRRILSLVLMTTTLGDLGACLKIRKIQYTDFSIFRMAAIGDWKGIKSLLDRRAEHPSATWWGGWTPLHYAIANGQAAVCKYLLSRNADPLLEDGDSQQSALEYAWTKILGKAYPLPRLLEFQSIFYDRECLEELGFTTLHKIVLDLNGRDLETELTSNPTVVDVPDNEGRTPLCWAAQRGDLDRLNILLAHGASPTASSRSKTTPLHFAAVAINPSCIAPLLRAGADVDPADHRGHTPLIQAANGFNNISYLRPLIAAGGDVNAATDYDYTPLISAICQGHDSSVRYLLDNGAKIEMRGQMAKTPLLYAVEYNAHEILSLLLARGADCTAQAQDCGPTIVHFAAKHADLETLEILTEGINGQFRVEDLEAEDYEGLVIEEVVGRRLREEQLPGFGEAFQKLLDKIVLRGDHAAAIGEEDEAWEDAVETPDSSWEHDEEDVWEEAAERL